MNFNRRQKWISGGLLAAVAAIATTLYLSRGQSEKKFREVPVKKGTVAVTILATGTVQPENRVDIKPPINGRVELVKVIEGQKVLKGQEIALMSSSERAALLDAARAKGLEELKKWEDLYRPTPILAPITGTIIQRNVESGQSFTSADAVLVMSDRLTVKAQVDETDISQIKLHQKATMVLDAYPDKSLPAQVDQIAYDAKTVNNVTTYVVDVLPDKIPEYMRSGMTANVTFFIDSKKDVLLVPSEAVKANKGVTTVTLSKDGSPVEQSVETGISDGKNVEVLSGVQESDIVLVPQFKMGDGKKGSGSPFTPGGGQRRAH